MVFILATLFAGLLFPSCEDDDTPSASNAVPQVRYVRITNPEKSDSLLTHAFMGNTVALIGEPALSQLYADALNSLGINSRIFDPKQLTLQGLTKAYQAHNS